MRHMVLTLLLYSNITLSQNIDIIVQDHPLEGSQPNMVHVEPHVASNPTDPLHLVAAAIVLDTAFMNWSSSAFASFDGGLNWSRHDFAMERRIDPWVMINNDGTVFITAIEILKNVKNDHRFNMLIFNSADGGVTWNDDKNSLDGGLITRSALFRVRFNTATIWLPEKLAIQ